MAAEPLRRFDVTDTCEPLSFVIVGHVDHGKSTVIGRLLADTDALPQGKIEQVRAFCSLNSRPFEYAFLLDTLKDEQSQGITIETTRVFFKTAKRRYMVLDAPGHIEFLKNMVTGAAKAEAALLVIDAAEGIQENSKRHGTLLSLLGIKQVAVLVNKMDLVSFSESSFNELKRNYSDFLKGVGVQPIEFIPISASLGDNLTHSSEKMPWYHGLTVIQMIDHFQSTPPVGKQPFRMPVQDVYKFTRYGDDRRIIAGTVESGTIAVGDFIEFLPSGKKSKIKSIEDGHDKSGSSTATSGQAIGICLHDQIYVKRGEVAFKTSEKPIRSASRLKTSLFWLGSKPMRPGKRYVFKTGTSRCEAELLEVTRVLDHQNLSSSEKQWIAPNETAECTLDLDQVTALETLTDHSTLSRFVLFDGFEPAGGGVVREILDDPHRDVKDEVNLRAVKWDQGLVTTEERKARNQHPAGLILISGAPSTPRKEISKALEKKLFESGHSVYYLGFGNLLSGIGAAIERDQTAEQMKMASEVAQVFLNAGTILIISLQDLSKEDFQMIRMRLPGVITQAVWVGTPGENDLIADLFIPPLLGSEELIFKHLESASLLKMRAPS
jgi:bifunctional enzyme CysN/CysC